MPSPSNSSGGTAFGLIAGLVVLAGIVAAPFYASHLRSDEAALDAAVADDLAVINRAVAKIDANLAELAAIRSTELGKIDASAIEGLSKKPQELNAQIMPGLKSVTDMLERARRRGEELGAVADSGKAMRSGPPDARASLGEAQKYMAECKELLQTAKKASTNLDTVEAGSLSARQHLGVLQARSSLHFVEGRLNLARATSERQQAEALFNAAVTGSETVVEMKRTAELCGAAAPTAPLEAVEKKIEETDSQIGKLKSVVDGLSKAVQQRQASLDELKRIAAEAREKQGQMDAKGFRVAPSRQAVGEFKTYEAEYRKLSETAAKAEKEAAEIENGTIAGGTLPTDDEILKATYQGGTAQPGLRDVKLRLEGLEQTLAAAEKMKADLVALQATFKEQADKLAEARSQSDAEAGKAVDQLEAMMAEAGKHTEAALKAADEAAKSFASAADAAGLAQAQSKKRVNDARTAAGERSEPDERLEKLKNDVSLEAAASFSKAEADYHHALAMAEKIIAVTTRAEKAAAVAKTAGTKEPESAEEVITNARTKGLERLALALGSFDQWLNLTKSLNVRTAEGINIAGKDLVWQGQVAKASALLLKARIEADRDVARGSVTQAYDLLKEAVQGKEQSPRLEQALATLLYIQRTAD